jgi:hypothetical protein
MMLTLLFIVGVIYCDACSFETHFDINNNGLTNYWQFNGSLRDQLSSNDVIAEGNTTTRFVAGRQGSSQAIHLPFTFLAISVDWQSSFTIAAWVNVATASDFTTLIGCGSEAAKVNTNSILAGLSHGPKRSPFLALDGTTLVSSKSPLHLGQWTHIVYTLDGKRGSIFINGALDATQQMATPVNVLTNTCFIGKRLDERRATAEISLQDLMIFNRSLDACQILALRNERYLRCINLDIELVNSGFESC